MNKFSKVLQARLPDIDIMDHLQEASPMLAAAGARPANSGDKEVYEEFKEATPLKQVDWNEAFPIVRASFSDDYVEVNRFGGEWTISRDDALKYAQARGQSGNMAFGYNEWMMKEEPYIMKATLMDMASATIYSPKRGLLGSSKTFGTMVGVEATDTSPNSYYSIAIVSWGRHTSLLLDENFYDGAGVDADGNPTASFFKETPLNSVVAGQIVPRKNETTKVLEVGTLMETSLGSLFVNPREITTIVNFTLDNIGAAFFKIVNQQIAKCRGQNKQLLAHPDVINALAEAEEAKTYSVGTPASGDGGNDNLVHIDMWKSVQMIGDYNFKEGSEAFQTNL